MGAVAGDNAVTHDTVDATIKVVRHNAPRLSFTGVDPCPVITTITITTSTTSVVRDDDDQGVVTRPRESKHRTMIVCIVHVDRHSSFGPRFKSLLFYIQVNILTDCHHPCRTTRRKSFYVVVIVLCINLVRKHARDSRVLFYLHVNIFRQYRQSLSSSYVVRRKS